MPVEQTALEATAALEDAEAPPKLSLAALLVMVKASDDGMLEADIDLEELGTMLRDKVDGITEYLDYCDARAAAIGRRAKELAAKAAAFKNKSESLYAYAAKYMHETEALAIPGRDYQFALRYSEAVKVTVEPDARIYLACKDLINREYSWKKNDLKKALKAGDPAVKAFAVIEKRPWLDIKPKV